MSKIKIDRPGRWRWNGWPDGRWFDAQYHNDKRWHGVNELGINDSWTGDSDEWTYIGPLPGKDNLLPVPYLQIVPIIDNRSCYVHLHIIPKPCTDMMSTYMPDELDAIIAWCQSVGIEVRDERQ